jgi:hypothetical protein
MGCLAFVLGSQGKYEEAEGMHRLTLALKEKVLGPEHPSTLMSMSNLAGVLANQGKHEEANEMRRRAPELYEKKGVSTHADEHENSGVGAGKTEQV